MKGERKGEARAGDHERSERAYEHEILWRVRRTILEEMEAIVGAVIEQAKKGRYLEARFLLELARTVEAGGDDNRSAADQDALVARFMQEFAGLRGTGQQPAAEASNQ